MPFSREDKILIKHYCEKGYGRTKIRKMWGVMEAKINFNEITTLDELKPVIVETWNSISQETIDKIIGSFRKRFRNVILQKGYTEIQVIDIIALC